MSVIKTNKVEVFMDHLLCDDCGTEMKYAHEACGCGSDFTYKHKCPKCGYTEYFKDIYPRRIEMEVVE